MKLTKSINRKVGKMVYHKYIMTIPKEFVEVLGWDEKTDLKFELDSKSLRIKKVKD